MLASLVSYRGRTQMLVWRLDSRSQDEEFYMNREIRVKVRGFGNPLLWVISDIHIWNHHHHVNAARVYEWYPVIGCKYLHRIYFITCMSVRYKNIFGCLHKACSIFVNDGRSCLTLSCCKLGSVCSWTLSILVITQPLSSISCPVMVLWYVDSLPEITHVVNEGW